MALAFGKSDDLVFDRRTVSGPRRLDLTGIHRRTLEILPDNLMASRRRIRDMTRNLRRHNTIGQIGKRHRRIVAVLLFQPIPINSAAIQSRWRSRLQTVEQKPGPL